MTGFLSLKVKLLSHIVLGVAPMVVLFLSVSVYSIQSRPRLSVSLVVGLPVVLPASLNHSLGTGVVGTHTATY